MIEELSASNIAEFVRLGRLSHAESRYRDAPFSEQRLLSTLAAPDIYARLCKKNDVYIGGMVAIIGFDFFTDVRIAFELTLYIQAEHRGGFEAVSLIRDCEKWCQLMGARALRPSITQGENSGVADGIYRKLGYTDFGKTYQKEFAK